MDAADLRFRNLTTVLLAAVFGPSFQILPDGNPHKVPWMVPTRGLGTPSFPTHPSMRATVINHASGPGPVSLPERYGSTHRSTESGVPFRKGTGGVLAGRSASRMDESPAGWRAVTGSCQRFTALVAKSLVTARMQDGGSRHVEPLRRWLR
jgi:hypothetical protein